MLYVSTRDQHRRERTFSEIVLEGLAPDRGLYIPKDIPKVELRWENRSYHQIMMELLRLYAPELEDETGCHLKELVEQASSAFSKPEVVALRRLGQSTTYIGELFHGPSYAFKDVALQLLPRILERLLRKQKRKLALLAATSGDTGAAAIYGVRGMKRIHLTVLHPHNRISEVQRRQMCNVLDPNICNIAIEGDFDECQSIVKTLLEQSRHQHDMPQLGAVNSINWCRILAQMSYYFALYFRLTKEHGRTAKVRFAVPTGNFGNALAGYFAREMGLPIELLVATNHNDMLHRYLAQGHCEEPSMRPSLAPAMDIVRPSNLERYLYYLPGTAQADAPPQTTQLANRSTATPPDAHQERTRSDFASYSSSNAEILQGILDCYEQYGYLLDPHTACAYTGCKQNPQRQNNEEETAFDICLATAHPAKFPEVYRLLPALEEAAGRVPPGLQLPDAHCRVLEADSATVLRHLCETAWQGWQ